MKFGAVLAGLALAVSLSGASRAADKLWTFEGTLLADGASVSGSFDYDADTQLYSNINVSVSAATYPAESFSHAILYNIFTGPTQLDLLPSSYAGGDATGLEQLYFVFSSALTDAGGTVPIVNSGISPQLLTCGNPICSTSSPAGAVLNGSRSPGAITTAVPEPASWALMIAGLGLAGATLRRRRSTAAA